MVGAPEYEIVGFPTAKLEDLEKLRYDAKRSVGSYYALGAIVNHQPESPEAIRTHAEQTLAKLKSTGFGATPPIIPLPAFYSNVFAKMMSTLSASTALAASVGAAAK